KGGDVEGRGRDDRDHGRWQITHVYEGAGQADVHGREQGRSDARSREELIALSARTRTDTLYGAPRGASPTLATCSLALSTVFGAVHLCWPSPRSAPPASTGPHAPMYARQTKKPARS